MLGVFRMLFDGSARPSKSSAARRTNGIFRENLSQRIRELLIKCQNLGATGHVFIVFPEVQDRALYPAPVRPGSMVCGICRDLRSTVDYPRMCCAHPPQRHHTLSGSTSRRRTGSRRQLRLPIQPSRLLVRSRIRSQGPTGVSAFIIAQLASMLAAVSIGRWYWRTEGPLWVIRDLAGQGRRSCLSAVTPGHSPA